MTLVIVCLVSNVDSVQNVLKDITNRKKIASVVKTHKTKCKSSNSVFFFGLMMKRNSWTGIDFALMALTAAALVLVPFLNLSEL
jgi:hypothetical protein